MARIDVSELMVDPDFVNSFTLVRRTPSINNFGENSFVETLVPSIGSIQSPGKETLNRLPEGVKLTNVKTVYTKAILTANQDQIEWEGQRYNIYSVLPWGNFGNGWYECDIELQKASL